MSVHYDITHQRIDRLSFHSITCVCPACLETDANHWATRRGDVKITFDRPPTDPVPAVARMCAE